MTLQFPTIAQRALAEWRAITNRTVPFNRIATRLGGTRDDEFGTIIWVFDDDTAVKITGRGPNHRVEALLP